MIVGVFGSITYWWAARRRGFLTSGVAMDWQPSEV